MYIFITRCIFVSSDTDLELATEWVSYFVNKLVPVIKIVNNNFLYSGFETKFWEDYTNTLSYLRSDYTNGFVLKFSSEYGIRFPPTHSRLILVTHIECYLKSTDKMHHYKYMIVMKLIGASGSHLYIYSVSFLYRLTIILIYTFI